MEGQDAAHGRSGWGKCVKERHSEQDESNERDAVGRQSQPTTPATDDRGSRRRWKPISTPKRLFESRIAVPTAPISSILRPASRSVHVHLRDSGPRGIEPKRMRASSRDAWTSGRTADDERGQTAATRQSKSESAFCAACCSAAASLRPSRCRRPLRTQWPRLTRVAGSPDDAPFVAPGARIRALECQSCCPSVCALQWPAIGEPRCGLAGAHGARKPPSHQSHPLATLRLRHGSAHLLAATTSHATRAQRDICRQERAHQGHACHQLGRAHVGLCRLVVSRRPAGQQMDRGECARVLRGERRGSGGGGHRRGGPRARGHHVQI